MNLKGQEAKEAEEHWKTQCKKLYAEADAVFERLEAARKKDGKKGEEMKCEGCKHLCRKTFSLRDGWKLRLCALRNMYVCTTLDPICDQFRPILERCPFCGSSDIKIGYRCCSCNSCGIDGPAVGGGEYVGMYTRREVKIAEKWNDRSTK